MITSNIFCSQIDVATQPLTPEVQKHGVDMSDIAVTLRDILACQKKQISLMEELIYFTTGPQRKRSNEIDAWKNEHPMLSRFCKQAADKLREVHDELLTTMTEEIHDQFETMLANEYTLYDFVDKFAPRIMHVSTLTQILTQMGSDGRT